MVDLCAFYLFESLYYLYSDYDPSASLAVGTQVQAAVNQSGPTNTSLVVVQGPPVGSNGQPPHNQMSSAPFT